MNLRRAFLLGLLLLIAGGRPAASADKPLVLGVFPSMTAKQTVEIYRPLASALEKHLQRSTVVYSARDFTTFVARSRQGEYDILLTAPHPGLAGATGQRLPPAAQVHTAGARPAGGQVRFAV